MSTFSLSTLSEYNAMDTVYNAPNKRAGIFKTFHRSLKAFVQNYPRSCFLFFAPQFLLWPFFMTSLLVYLTWFVEGLALKLVLCQLLSIFTLSWVMSAVVLYRVVVFVLFKKVDEPDELKRLRQVRRGTRGRMRSIRREKAEPEVTNLHFEARDLAMRGVPNEMFVSDLRRRLKQVAMTIGIEFFDDQGIKTAEVLAKDLDAATVDCHVENAIQHVLDPEVLDDIEDEWRQRDTEMMRYRTLALENGPMTYRMQVWRTLCLRVRDFLGLAVRRPVD